MARTTSVYLRASDAALRPCADISVLSSECANSGDVGESDGSRVASPADEGEPPAKRPNTDTAYPTEVGVSAPSPPPVPPPLTTQPKGSAELSEAVLPFVAEMQMTLSIVKKLLNVSAHNEDEDPVQLAQQLVHLVSTSLQPLSHSVVTVAQQHIESWSSSSWQQEPADVPLSQMMSTANALELDDVSEQLDDTAPMSTSPTPTATLTPPLDPPTTSDEQMPTASVISLEDETQPPNHTTLSHPPTPPEDHAAQGSDSHTNDLQAGCNLYNQATWSTTVLLAGMQSVPHQTGLPSAVGCYSDLDPFNLILPSAANGLGAAQLTLGFPQLEDGTTSTILPPPPVDRLSLGEGPGTSSSMLSLACSPSVPSLDSHEHNRPITDGTDFVAPGPSSQSQPVPIAISNSQEALEFVPPLPPQSHTPKADTAPQSHTPKADTAPQLHTPKMSTPPTQDPSLLPAHPGGPGPSPYVLPGAANSSSGPSGTPDDVNISPVSDDFDDLSDDEYDILMKELELASELGGPLPRTGTSAPSAAVQMWAARQVGYFSPYDRLASLPHVGVADRQEKLTAKGLPLYWSTCVRCSPRCTKNYHMVWLEDGLERDRVAGRLRDARLEVTSVSRVQNEVLWQRYKSEQVLMLQGAGKGYRLNEAWLYHTTSAAVEVICEEGLDPRLARAGSFGFGTYFSDDPRKCFKYVKWNREDQTYQMLLCRVLLGDTKVYGRGTNDRMLRREPVKEYPVPGGKKTYDSVQGNITGHNEYVVYNAYRVLPEYVIEYRK